MKLPNYCCEKYDTFDAKETVWIDDIGIRTLRPLNKTNVQLLNKRYTHFRQKPSPLVQQADRDQRRNLPRSGYEPCYGTRPGLYCSINPPSMTQTIPNFQPLSPRLGTTLL